MFYETCLHVEPHRQGSLPLRLKLLHPQHVDSRTPFKDFVQRSIADTYQKSPDTFDLHIHTIVYTKTVTPTSIVLFLALSALYFPLHCPASQ